MRKLVQELVEEIAKEKNIEVTFYSFDWIIRLFKGSKTRFIVGNRFDLNTQAISKILDDKYALYLILKEYNIPVIEHKMLFNPMLEGYFDESTCFNAALEYFFNNNQNVVLKPNRGSEGNGVYHCDNILDLEKNLFKLFKKNSSISICPFFNIKMEYRAIVLHSNIEYLYGKEKPVIVGDGKSTIFELINTQNINIPDKKIAIENLFNLDLFKVPLKNEVIEFSWKFNLSGGANIVSEIPVKKVKIIEKIVDNITKRLDIEFVTIDIVETIDGEFYVMEINSGVMMEQLVKLTPNGREIAKNIYAKAIDKMLN